MLLATLVASMASEKVTLISVFAATDVALSAGFTEETVGAVVSLIIEDVLLSLAFESSCFAQDEMATKAENNSTA